MERFNDILNKSIKVLVVANIIIMLTIGSFFVQPVFADSSSSVVDIPICSVDESKNIDNTLVYFANSSVSQGYSISDDKRVVTAVYKDGSLYKGVQLATSSAILNVSVFNSSGTFTNSTTLNVNYSYNYDGVSYQYNASNQFNNYAALGMIPFDSQEAAILACIEYINTPISPGISSFSNTVVVEPGYIVFALCEGGSVDMRTQMPVNSSLNVVGIPWDSTSRIAFGVDRPTSGTTYDAATFGSRINWDKDSAADSNWLGMTKFAVAHYDDLPSNGSFVAIMNPAYYGDSIQNPDVNGSIYATFTNLGAVVKYPMNTSLTLGVGGVMKPVITSNTDWSDYAIAVPTTDGAISAPNYIWNNTSQPAIEFPDGGQNDISHSNNDIQGIAGLINRLINLLSSPVDHIKSLFNAGSAYFSVLAQMFTWLPPEVYSVLVNCLICALVIGVIKLLF